MTPAEKLEALRAEAASQELQRHQRLHGHRSALRMISTCAALGIGKLKVTDDLTVLTTANTMDMLDAASGSAAE